eukprot:2347256-Rhodomonas_salina.3
MAGLRESKCSGSARPQRDLGPVMAMPRRRAEGKCECGFVDSDHCAIYPHKCNDMKSWAWVAGKGNA